VTQISTGVKRIIRQACAEDDVDICEKFLDRDLSHISPEIFQQMYSTRLSAEQREKLQAQWKHFTGTLKYHNYTKDVKAH